MNQIQADLALQHLFAHFYLRVHRFCRMKELKILANTKIKNPSKKALRNVFYKENRNAFYIYGC